jgi:peptidoglycan/LPS O-acetylase OafA/YrhL
LKRLSTLDTTRGLLMLYIVAFVHGVFWLKLLPLWGASLFLFEMPAVFVVSGMAFAHGMASLGDRPFTLSGLKAYGQFLASRWTRILVPYLLYALVCTVYVASLTDATPGAAHGWLSPGQAWLNPFIYGRGASVSVLNWHLWFVPVFLIVSALMPWVSRIGVPWRPDLLVWVAGCLILALGFSALRFQGEDLVKPVVFFSLFSALGFHMVRQSGYFSQVRWAWIASLCLALLALLALRGGAQKLDMQVNKFPPNYIYFLFSCLWLAVFMLIPRWAPGLVRYVMVWGDRAWLRPFKANGYSIYLWQGMGYTLAIRLGVAAHWPAWVVWLVAIGLSVGLGMLAAPLEKVRWPMRRVQALPKPAA